MKKRKLIPVTSYDEVPPSMTEDEARTFWSTHEITEEYLASAPPVTDSDLPSAASDRPTSWVAVHVPRPVFQRLRATARERGVSVADLIDQLMERELAAEDSRMRASSS